jgi:DNA-binding CsgD family transcriptional regulator
MSRLRALVGRGDAAEDAYREAIERLDRSGATALLARTRLVFGEWLRRERRRREARAQLRGALEMLTDMGMDAFAARAERELLATGERVRKHVVETGKDLTAQEAQIARLARDGLSNPEIGARLFISPRTVKYHLHKVFTKLDITSRSQLERVLSPDPAPMRPV